MRKFYLLLIGLICCLPSAWGLDASLSFARFLTPDGAAYLEFHTHIAGSTITWQPISEGDSLYQAKVEITLILKDGENITVADKFLLNSPVGVTMTDFIDLKRYKVTAGKSYLLEMLVVDSNKPENQRSYRTEINVDAWPSSTSLSDIVLLANVSEANPDLGNHPFLRHGIMMEPLPYNFYGRGANLLSFYTEAYSPDMPAGERFLVLTKIEALRNGDAKPVRAVNKVVEVQPLIPHLQQVDISGLPTGNYLLAVEIRSAQNELISRRELPFQRANPLVDEEERAKMLAEVDIADEFVGPMNYDSLRYSTLALLPLLPQNEVFSVNEMMRNKNAEALRIYLFAFWTRESPFNPEQGYRDFMDVANFVNKTFYSGFRNGFETDRGYVYLKYGQPNDINRVETDPSAPPYEIWSYDVIEMTNQHNCRFVFYNPSLAADDFVLLHSNVIGERNNPQWELELYRDAPNEQPADFINGTEMQDNLGRRARRLLTDY